MDTDASIEGIGGAIEGWGLIGREGWDGCIHEGWTYLPKNDG